MTDDRSWIKCYRSLMSRPAIWNSDIMTRLWLYCCFSANWRETEWTIPGTFQRIILPRGSFLTGRSSLHAKLYPKHDENGFPISYDHVPSDSTLWRKLQSLEKMGCLNIENLNNRCSKITILNYDFYQDSDQPVEQPNESGKCLQETVSGFDAQTVEQPNEQRFAQPVEQPVVSRSNLAEQPVDTAIEDKKVLRRKNERNGRFVRPSVEEISGYCRERGNGVDAQRFFDYYESKGWLVGKTKMTDWRAAVRTWERNDSAKQKQSMSSHEMLMAEINGKGPNGLF